MLLSEAGQCRDPIAADARLGQVARTLAPVRQVLPPLSPADRANAARGALVLTTLTFPARYPDDWLCRPRGDGPAAFRRYAAWGPGYYTAPCYRYPLRCDRYLIFPVSLPTKTKKSNHWVLRGVALLTTTA